MNCAPCISSSSNTFEEKGSKMLFQSSKKGASTMHIDLVSSVDATSQLPDVHCNVFNLFVLWYVSHFDRDLQAKGCTFD
jgi:hypothetical protein